VDEQALAQLNATMLPGSREDSFQRREDSFKRREKRRSEEDNFLRAEAIEAAALLQARRDAVVENSMATRIQTVERSRSARHEVQRQRGAKLERAGEKTMAAATEMARRELAARASSLATSLGLPIEVCDAAAAFDERHLAAVGRARHSLVNLADDATATREHLRFRRTVVAVTANRLYTAEAHAGS